MARLVDLDPRWLEKDGRRIGFVFKCPHCQQCYLSCFFEPMEHISGPDGQYHFIAQVLGPEDVHRTVPCKRNYAWNVDPPASLCTFENMTVTPSIDASDAKCWHGSITNGEATP